MALLASKFMLYRIYINIDIPIRDQENRDGLTPYQVHDHALFDKSVTQQAAPRYLVESALVESIIIILSNRKDSDEDLQH